ncbi:MAG: carboxypeptidase regulatory-like domain-containing protein, partial [Chloroflexi bacterium CFX6]|nr:carboxypeptidase regulatory-like domain-containing protein [Chloroflexi bacterium CFX6]
PAPPTPAAPAIRPPETAPGPLPPTAHASVTPGATASLPATGIAGRVMDPDGLPIPGAVVVAEPFDGAGWFVVALAADDGTYALEIAPGRFRAHAEALGHATRWWDDRPEPAAADPVIVAATGMVSGVDFRLPLASNPAVPTIAKEVVR